MRQVTLVSDIESTVRSVPRWGDGHDHAYHRWWAELDPAAHPLAGYDALDHQIVAFNAVEFFNAGTGVAVGGPHGGVVRTVDGGDSWTYQHIEEMTEMFALSFADDEVGYIAGAATGSNGGVLRTDDGGKTWVPRHPPGDLVFGGEGLGGVSSPSADVATVVGAEALIVRTEDGGNSWVLQHHNLDMGPLEDVQFLDEQLGWAVGQGGRIFHTSNGGDTWGQQFSTTTRMLHSVRFINSEVGWAVGDGGTVVHTTDGGDSWQEQPTETGRSLSGVWFADATTGWVVGVGGMILYTTDGGASWAEYTSALTREPLLGVSFPTATSGTAVGVAGIVRTTDGGDTWQSRDSGATAGFSSVSFPTESVGTAVGDNGTILRTEDGGQSWQKQDSRTTSTCAMSTSSTLIGDGS